MIQFSDVEFFYQEMPRPAVSGVSFDVSPGEIVALVGANGSGKSTIARLCNGLLEPCRGRVTVDGIDTCESSETFMVRSRVGLVLQNPENQIVGTVVEEDVAFGPENLGIAPSEIRQRVDEAISSVGLVGLERREPHLLSEGQKQRLAVAGVLALRPTYLVFDEPTAMLDPRGRGEIRAIITTLRAEGRGILYITHHLEEVMHMTRVIGLEHGRIVFDGSPEQLLGSPELLDRLGLEPSPLSVMAAELRRLGYQVPVAVSDGIVLVDAVCR